MGKYTRDNRIHLVNCDCRFQVIDRLQKEMEKWKYYYASRICILSGFWDLTAI